MVYILLFARIEGCSHRRARRPSVRFGRRKAGGPWCQRDEKLGAKRWVLIVICVALYLGPIHLLCPIAGRNWLDPVCLTASYASAGLIYKLYSAGWMVLVVLSAFHRTPSARVRRRIALWVAAIFLPVSLILHIPYFVWFIPVEAPSWLVAYYDGVALMFVVWLLLHRLLARWRFVWDRLDPDGVVPPQDRRRALFWHPATALLFHHLAATTNLWWITLP